MTRHSEAAPLSASMISPEHRGRDVQVDAAGSARHRGADGPGDAAADVLGTVDAIGRLREPFGRRHLVQLLVVAAFQVDDVALAGSGDLHHRKAVRRRIRQGDEAVEEPRAGHRQAHAGLAREEPGRRGRVDGVAFVPEADVADARACARRARSVIGMPTTP